MIWIAILLGALITNNPPASSENNYKTLRDLFSKKGEVIPREYLIGYLQVDTSALKGSEFKTDSIVRLNHGYEGLIYKMECGSAGICESYYLCSFKDEKISDKLEVRHHLGDAGWSDQLTCTFAGDTIKLKQIVVKNPKSDREQITEKLERVLINPSGQFERK